MLHSRVVRHALSCALRFCALSCSRVLVNYSLRDLVISLTRLRYHALPCTRMRSSMWYRALTCCFMRSYGRSCSRALTCFPSCSSCILVLPSVPPCAPVLSCVLARTLARSRARACTLGLSRAFVCSCATSHDTSRSLVCTRGFVCPLVLALVVLWYLVCSQALA